MNTIFIDFKCKDSKEKKSINNIRKLVTNKIFKYIVNDDILNNSLSKITYIRIDREYINIQLQKGKYSIYDKILKLNINRKYGKNDVVHLIFSKEFDKNQLIKKYILGLFRLNKVTIYEELDIKNNLKVNDKIYMDKYIRDNKIDLCKLKILIVLDHIKDYDEKKLLEYISKYKFIDILKTKNINKYDSAKLQGFIQKINNEYGTTIDLIGRRNIQKYNIYLLYSKIDRDSFIQKYILNSKSLYLDLNDVDMDVMSDEYICYKRYEPEILTILNRLEINKNNFIKVKLGFLFKWYILKMYYTWHLVYNIYVVLGGD